MLAGKWTYRSYLNNPALVGEDAAAALALIFGEGTFDFEPENHDRFIGGLGMGSGYALSLEGLLIASDPVQFSIIGRGIPGTATDGWRYDYHGTAGYTWPSGTDQVSSLLGTVLRVNAHGANAPAGVTASFIAVRQPETISPRMARRSSLTMGL